MTLRVISGTAKGRKLKAVPGDTTRPVTDRVKEALFNILAADVVDSTWWDLFGGTGAIGIEALSRGATFVRFTELSKVAIGIIRDNLVHCKFIERSEILRGDAYSFIGATPNHQFDYVYIAPPQYKEMWVECLQKLDANTGWLGNDAEVIVQIDPIEYHQVALRNLAEFEQRKYGSTLLVFYQNKQE